MSRVIRKYGSYSIDRQTVFMSPTVMNDSTDLINGTWNQTGEFLFELLAEDEWKRRTDTRCSLNGGKGDLSNAITVSKTEDS